MCLYSDFWKSWEKTNLAPYAIKNDDPWYAHRESDKNKDDPMMELMASLDPSAKESRYKLSFEIDRERILNSQAFRRLEYKTQMFVNHEGDNYRTRLTHTLEVVAVGRYIAKALRLNEALVEAIGLGHDLGHAPFGHAGEDALNDMLRKTILKNDKKIKKEVRKNEYYFCHNRQSLSVVERMERGYDWDRRCKGFQRGMDLSRATREGIVAHTNRGLSQAHLRENYADKRISYPGSLESQVIRLADEIAQRTHDLEDGLRSGLLNRDVLVKKMKSTIDSFVEKIEQEELNGKQLMFFEDSPEDKFPIYLFREKIEQLKEIIDKDPDIKGSRHYRFCRENIEQLFVVMTKLLYIWRDEEYLAAQKEKHPLDFNAYSNRIIKYTHIYILIACINKPKQIYITAFLRGLLISNSIEHSYSRIRYGLDKQLHDFVGMEGSVVDQDEDFFLIFIDYNVDENSKDHSNPKSIMVRISSHNEDRIRIDNPYMRVNGEKNWYGSDLEEFEEITYTWLTQISLENKNPNFIAEALSGSSWNGNYQIFWLNKDKNPEKCTGIRIQLNGEEYGIKNQQVQIYFRQLPLRNRQLYKNEKKIKNLVDNKIVISLSPEMETLDEDINGIIKRHLHNHSKVERMNVKGKMMIKRLFELYFKYPRVMNSRVWERLNIYDYFYKDRDVLKEFEAYDFGIPSNKQIAAFHNCKDLYEEINLLLSKRITDHISGMTDRFIYDEYDRLFSAKKEIESPEDHHEF